MSTTTPKPTLLLIVDGVGINPSPAFNAVAMAKTPVWDGLVRKYPHTQLRASEEEVGLPRGFAGNSEVGHLNIGAGRIVPQDFTRIGHEIEQGSFFGNKSFSDLFEALKSEKGRPVLHLMGLVSDGAVHSHLSHLFALIQMAKRNGIERVWVHGFTDGRDSAPTSGLEYVRQVQNFCRETRIGRFGTLIGRFYAMDRDNRWDRTEAAFRAIVHAEGASFSDPLEYVQRHYDQSIGDEFLPPAVASAYPGIRDGDGVIFFNFRADRARQLTRAFTQTEFPHFRRQSIPTLSGFVTMTAYDESLSVPVAFERPKLTGTLGEIVSRHGWKQLRIAETEKYAHVTYFFNGGEERVFDGEKRILVPSPRDVVTYDQKPEMSGPEMTSQLLAELKGGGTSLAVVNFAGPDMVGHTGNLRAAVRAVEAVDACLGKIIDWVESHGAVAIVTSDHGNCESMQDGRGLPLTAHTTRPVPFILVDPGGKGTKLAAEGRLADIAPTLLALWGVKQPAEMTGRSLLQ